MVQVRDQSLATEVARGGPISKTREYTSCRCVREAFFETC